MNEAPARRIRRTARVVLLDPEDRVLLFRYAAKGFAPFWIMPGGECEPGEEYPETAHRELLEETGILARPRPIEIVRQADYEYLGEPVRSIEHFFQHRTTTIRIDTSGHTELERDVMQEHRWFVRAELMDWHETIYPRDIVELVALVRERETRLVD